MATGTIPPDFKEFLKLLNHHKINYLLVGGYAVGYYGYPRATVDMDIWVSTITENLVRLIAALQEFGIEIADDPKHTFTVDGQMLRVGIPPMRLEILTKISGVTFEDCYAGKTQVTIDDVDISIISLEDLKMNKKAAGRHKDLNDLEHLP